MRLLALEFGAGINNSRRDMEQLYISPITFASLIDLVYSPEIVDKRIIASKRRVNSKLFCWYTISTYVGRKHLR